MAYLRDDAHAGGDRLLKHEAEELVLLLGRERC